MATMIAYTAIDLPAEQKRALCAGVEKRASEAFQIDIQITCFVYTAPNKTDDQRRRLVKNIYDATIAVTGPLGKSKVIVIIKEHASNNVGVDGVLRCDL